MDGFLRVAPALLVPPGHMVEPATIRRLLLDGGALESTGVDGPPGPRWTAVALSSLLRAAQSFGLGGRIVLYWGDGHRIRAHAQLKRPVSAIGPHPHRAAPRVRGVRPLPRPIWEDLPPRLGAVLAAYLVEGRTLAEIAEDDGIPHGRAGQLFRKALEALREGNRAYEVKHLLLTILQKQAPSHRLVDPSRLAAQLAPHLGGVPTARALRLLVQHLLAGTCTPLTDDLWCLTYAGVPPVQVPAAGAWHRRADIPAEELARALVAANPAGLTELEQAVGLLVLRRHAELPACRRRGPARSRRARHRDR